MKKQLMEITEKYHMELFKHYITNQTLGFYTIALQRLEDLDELESKDISPACVTRDRLGQGWRYIIYVPENWVDLWGWVEGKA